MLFDRADQGLDPSETDLENCVLRLVLCFPDAAVTAQQAAGYH